MTPAHTAVCRSHRSNTDRHCYTAGKKKTLLGTRKTTVKSRSNANCLPFFHTTKRARVWLLLSHSRNNRLWREARQKKFEWWMKKKVRADNRMSIYPVGHGDHWKINDVDLRARKDLYKWVAPTRGAETGHFSFARELRNSAGNLFGVNNVWTSRASSCWLFLYWMSLSLVMLVCSDITYTSSVIERIWLLWCCMKLMNLHITRPI